jgi:hypothetical protein
MKNKIKWNLFLSNLICLVLLIGGIVLAYNKIEGWGWLIFGGFVVYYSS